MKSITVFFSCSVPSSHRHNRTRLQDFAETQNTCKLLETVKVLGAITLWAADEIICPITGTVNDYQWFFYSIIFDSPAHCACRVTLGPAQCCCVTHHTSFNRKTPACYLKSSRSSKDGQIKGETSLNLQREVWLPLIQPSLGDKIRLTENCITIDPTCTKQRVSRWSL